MSTNAPYPIVSTDPAVQSFYELCRRKGQTHMFAEMCAFRQGPGFKGLEQNMFQGMFQHQGLNDVFDPEHYVRHAHACGVSTAGKVYIGGLADYPSDPEAWVADRDDMIRVARKKGKNIEGAVNFQSPVPDGAGEPECRLGPDIVAEEMERRIEQDPSLAEMDQHELAHEIIEEHGRPKDK